MSERGLRENEFQKGERLYLGHGEAQEERDHLDRYRFAAGFLKPTFVVLDAACGSGYGSQILAEKTKSVTGLEFNEHALEHAKTYYQAGNITFLKQDLNASIALPGGSFDAVVSFETFEHIVNQGGLLAEFKRLLKPGGVLVISTPDKDILSGKSQSRNPFHVKELSKKEFISLLNKYFDVKEIYGQLRYVPMPLWKRCVKLAAKLDVFKVKRLITRGFGLQRSVHAFFNQAEEAPIQKTTVESSDYFHVIAVCGKK